MFCSYCYFFVLSQFVLCNLLVLWLKSPLREAVQSEHGLIMYGVPRGSDLGPLLFIIFVNDLPLAVSRSIVDIYADDTTLSASAAVSDLPAIHQRLQEDINRIAD